MCGMHLSRLAVRCFETHVFVQNMTVFLPLKTAGIHIEDDWYKPISEVSCKYVFNVFGTSFSFRFLLYFIHQSVCLLL